MTSWSILGHTAKVLEERRDDYGEAADQFRAIAARWSITLGTDPVACQVRQGEQRVREWRKGRPAFRGSSARYPVPRDDRR
jgi:hypothetical protein